MRKRKKGRKAPKLDRNSRYLLRYNRSELIEKTLTKRLYFLVLHKGECTTSEIYSILKASGFDGEKNIVRRYLNTMYKHGLLDKTIRGANVDYWKLGEKRIADEELIRTFDMGILKNTYSSDSISFTEDGVHIYGFSQMDIHKDPELQKILSLASLRIKEVLYQLVRTKFIIFDEKVNEKIDEWKKKHPDPWDEAILIVCLAGLELNFATTFTHYTCPGTKYCPDAKNNEDRKNTGVHPAGRLIGGDQTYTTFEIYFPHWIKKNTINGKTMIHYTQDNIPEIVDIAKALQKYFFPSSTPDEIYSKLNNYEISEETLDLCEFLQQQLDCMEPISIVCHSMETSLTIGSQYATNYGKPMNLSLMGLTRTGEEFLKKELITKGLLDDARYLFSSFDDEELDYKKMNGEESPLSFYIGIFKMFLEYHQKGKLNE